MTHWYRDPKQLKLMEHLHRADIGFVLSSDDFSDNDLLHLKTTLGSLHQTSKIVRLRLLRKPVAIPKPSAIHFCNAKYRLFQ